jgi:membrane-bound lytic murein transglycosylase B
MTLRRAAALLLVLSATPAAADFRECLGGLRSQAAGQGVSGQTFDAVTAALEPDMKIFELMDNQPEFKTPIWDYVAALVDEERVVDGRSRHAPARGALAGAESRYGSTATSSRASGASSPISARTSAAVR